MWASLLLWPTPCSKRMAVARPRVLPKLTDKISPAAVRSRVAFANVHVVNAFRSGAYVAVEQRSRRSFGRRCDEVHAPRTAWRLIARQGRASILCVLVSAVWAAVALAQVHVHTRIVSSVELVEVPFIIFDNQGRIATDLKKTDFRLTEDGVEQTILNLDLVRVPVSFVVLADLSSSMTHKIAFVQDAALSLLDPEQPRGKQRDEYSVVSVSTRSRLLVPFTSDQQDLERRLPLLLTPTDGSTSLFDGIWLGVNTAEDDAANEHCAMIVITDGGDNHSRYNLRQTKTLLEETDVPVFAVMAGPIFGFPMITPAPPIQPRGGSSEGGSKQGLPDLPFFKAMTEDYIGPAERRGPHNMKDLTEATGGGVFTARREEDLARIVRTIGLAVRYRYVLTYRPSRDDPFQQTGSTAPVAKDLHLIHLELFPKAKFIGYSTPYYKKAYRSSE
jgi:Ca-activated chloride channel family protein